jgi:hypothetical protein
MQIFFTGLRQSLATDAPTASSTPSGVAGPIGEVAALDAPIALAIATDPGAAAVASDVSAAHEQLNADLIASLPRSELDALLPEPQATTSAIPMLYNPDVAAVSGAPAWRDTVGGGAQYGGDLIRHRSLKQQAQQGAHEVGGEFFIGPAAMAYNLAQRARQAGLSETEARSIKLLLRSGSHPEDAALVTELLETKNAAAALRTFLGLQLDRSIHADRITPDIVRALTLGVGQARTAASEGSEGILNQVSALAAARALVGMSPEMYKAMRGVLSGGYGIKGPPPGADAQTERALILKAIGARETRLKASSTEAGNAYAEIAAFAAYIGGQNAQRLIERTSAIDLDGDGADEALQQAWQNTSAAAVLEMLRAESDPIYALALHTSAAELKPGQWIGATPANAPDEQASMVETLGTEAVERGDARGANSGMVLATMASAESSQSGKPFERVKLDDSTRVNALMYIEGRVREGFDVAIAVSTAPGQRHAMAITDVRGSGTSREFLVTDPWTGRTEWISNADVLAGNIGGGGVLTDYWL